MLKRTEGSSKEEQIYRLQAEVQAELQVRLPVLTEGQV